MNPYEVLGVPQGADMETVKKAYRELAKQYHPDKYVNNPLASLAEEKLKEINKAYDMITSGNGGSSGSGTGDFSQIRMLIQQGRLSDADRILDASSVRNAEWNFLKGLVAIQRGWVDRAINYLNTACQMDPSNMEYRNVLNQLNSNVNSYRTQGNQNGYPQRNSGCDCCGQLICADCCCECMGGDLISCC